MPTRVEVNRSLDPYFGLAEADQYKNLIKKMFDVDVDVDLQTLHVMRAQADWSSVVKEAVDVEIDTVSDWKNMTDVKDRLAVGKRVIKLKAVLKEALLRAAKPIAVIPPTTFKVHNMVFIKVSDGTAPNSDVHRQFMDKAAMANIPTSEHPHYWLWSFWIWCIYLDVKLTTPITRQSVQVAVDALYNEWCAKFKDIEGYRNGVSGTTEQLMKSVRGHMFSAAFLLHTARAHVAWVDDLGHQPVWTVPAASAHYLLEMLHRQVYPKYWNTTEFASAELLKQTSGVDVAFPLWVIQQMNAHRTKASGGDAAALKTDRKRKRNRKSEGGAPPKKE